MIEVNFLEPKLKLKEQLKHLHISDIADLFEEELEHRELIIELIGIKRFSEVYIDLNDKLQVKYYLKLNEKQRQELLRHFKLDDLKTFIELFRVSYHEEIFKLLNKETKEKVIKLLKYDNDTVGSYVSPYFIKLPLTLSVAEVTDYVIKNSSDSDEIDVIFFEENKRFMGAISLQDLITARKIDILEDLIDDNFPYSYEDDLLGSAVHKIRNYDVLLLPILNDKKEIIGVLTQKDALEIMQSDYIDALEGLVQLNEHDGDSNVIKRSVNRLPWLLMSVVMNIIIVSFLTGFTSFLDENIVLVMFQSMILGMAGNIGTQSIAVTILGLHQDKINPTRHIKKEIGVALINSILVSLLSVIITTGFLYFTKGHEGFMEIYQIPFIVGLSLFFSMFVSALIGVLLPFMLRKIGADEKAAAGPIISTVNDFAALTIYFLVAIALLNIL